MRWRLEAYEQRIVVTKLMFLLLGEQQQAFELVSDNGGFDRAALDRLLPIGAGERLGELLTANTATLAPRRMAGGNGTLHIIMLLELPHQHRPPSWVSKQYLRARKMSLWCSRALFSQISALCSESNSRRITSARVERSCSAIHYDR